MPDSSFRDGNRGTTLTPARPAHTPNASSSDKPLPSPAPLYDPPPRPPGPPHRNPHPRKPGGTLDTNNKEDSFWRRFQSLQAAASKVHIRMICTAALSTLLSTLGPPRVSTESAISLAADTGAHAGDPGLPRPLARTCCWSAGCPRLDPWYWSSIAANASACDLARDDAHVYIARTARPGPDADVLL